jgi:chromosomal replication initiation ATPase DnaA
VPITSDVIEFIARKVVSNIRELEGALNRIVAYASMGAMPISIELAQAVCRILYNPRAPGDAERIATSWPTTTAFRSTS